MGYSYRYPTIIYLCSFLFISQILVLFSQAANNITQGQLVRDGETILSSGENFVLGFFSPANSTSRYVGIWYNKVSEQTVIWVANRESPISGENGTLTVGNDGNLLISDGMGNSVWSANASTVSGNSTAILQDSGDLVLTNDSNQVLWQSFDDPTDTFLPGMKAYANAQAGENRAFTSWKSANDPSPGNYSMGIDPRASPQLLVWEHKNRRWRSGHWDGQIFLGVPRMKSLYSYGFKLNNDGDGQYFTYTTIESTHIVRFMVTWDGVGQQLIWNQKNKNWTLLQKEPLDECDEYNECGNFGMCTVGDSKKCACIEGFEAQYKDQWNNGNWSGGCVRRTTLQCDNGTSSDGFLAVDGVKFPDYADTVMAKNTSECHTKCLTNCSCIAYAYLDGIDCMIWGGDLLDVERLEDGGGTLYVRVAESELGGSRKISNLAIIMTVVPGTVFLIISIWLLWRSRAKLKAHLKKWRKNHDPSMLTVSRSREFSADFSGQDDLTIDGKQGSGPELPLFSFNYVEVATNFFANENKLGRGGFGPVFKGTLPGGQEIAVKRLSRRSGQGLEEFKNELILIAKLQHRNLVRLLGCCIEGDEKILVYEYMPNKSLDFFLFDPAKKAQLDWRMRFTIIEGIARGILYLHRDSRLRIIHRDLKASNILLDEEMNPKISDFGMARIFGGNENETETNRVVGTYGYMSPEYAMDGLFSVKSDVYSFGVLLLEIVSGQRNTSFHFNECSNLIRYAWKLWNDGKSMELIDPSIVDSCSEDEVLRCIHVGILCVQESAVYRPNMSSVVLMLESENAKIPMPKQPTFTSLSVSGEMDMEEGEEVEEGHDNDITSSNDVTVTGVIGRYKKVDPHTI
ncbi:G-type lectin S-receptor-like serine/threonine-protein kinase B120 isoform X2 [Cornus florida]|uniref:G-type lectin S-receptor-like serine/threonine-protein kinase B120 isoform X2 n=1 Tax=Cornus florida TaxID=4283 RepID=UPI0028A1CE3D|nr:G-type lectin S-receptor-like serine/threonine-protein kinase B120 isoform X2 [Cornus florida]